MKQALLARFGHAAVLAASIGTLHGAALVGSRGTIYWACMRRFDSGGGFCRLPDARRGGAFELRAEDPRSTRDRASRTRTCSSRSSSA